MLQNQAKKVDKPEPFQEDESWMRAKQQLKPEDQLDLTADVRYIILT